LIPDYGIWTRHYEKQLKKRWEGEENRINEIVNYINCGKDWTTLLVKSDKHNFEALPYVNDGCVKYVDGYIEPPDLRGINLIDAKIKNAQHLNKTAFDKGKLINVVFSNVSLAGASFKKCEIVNVSFDKSSLEFANFTEAKISRSEFFSSILSNADFRDLYFEKTIFSDVTINDVKFNIEPHFGFISRIFRKRVGTRFRDIDLNFDFSVFQRIDRSFYKFLLNEQYIDDIKRNSKILYFFLYLINDFGRSILRLFLWIFITWIFFGYLYAGLPFTFGLNRIKLINEALILLTPDLTWGVNCKDYSEWFEPLYYSGIVMTSLGSSSINVNDCIGKFYVLVESITGFIFLSGFVSILIMPGKRYQTIRDIKRED